jgi:hypothetical protein
LIELRFPKTYVAVGVGFARSVLLPKLLLITVNSEGWEEFSQQNNRSNENNHLLRGSRWSTALGDTTAGVFSGPKDVSELTG